MQRRVPGARIDRVVVGQQREQRRMAQREGAGLQARIRAREAARARAHAEWSWFGAAPEAVPAPEPVDLISDYGATNEAEFFAVVTEVFFEQADALADRHPALFAVLRDYYRVDPRNWH